MDLLHLGSWSTTAVVALFVGSAAVVWFAGGRMTDYSQIISDRTGLGRAFVGMILLGAATSLPEVGTTISAAISGNPALAVNNVLGSASINIAIVALVDASLPGRQALATRITEPTVLLQGSLAILMLVLVAAAITVGDRALFGVGAGSSAALALFLVSMWLSYRLRGEETWLPRPEAERRYGHASPTGRAGERGAGDGEDPTSNRRSTRAIAVLAAAAAVVILLAGYVLTRGAEAIAERTGLGTSFVGAVLLALATSLPELSSAVRAGRRGAPELAVADLFGTNLFNVVLIFVVDVAYGGEPVLNQVGRFGIFAALLAAGLTAIFLVGLLERRRGTVLRIGLDSLAVLVAYLGGVYLLYTLR